jgi:hypothetical protein
MIVLYDPKQISSYTVDDEAAGYDFDNCIRHHFSQFEWDKPWLEYRSVTTGSFTVTLNFSGAAVTCLAILGANFTQITKGSTYTLSKNEVMGDYRGIFTFAADSSPLTFTMNESPSEGYYKMTTCIIGTEVTLSAQPVREINKSLMLPRPASELLGGSIKFGTMGRKHHIITYQHRGMDKTQYDELRTFKRTVGKDDAFIVADNLGEQGDVYLARRTDDLLYTEKSYRNIEEKTVIEEIG